MDGIELHINNPDEAGNGEVHKNVLCGLHLFDVGIYTWTPSFHGIYRRSSGY